MSGEEYVTIVIDVVIPTRNRGALIADTLKSLRASTYPRFRVLVVDQSEGRETAEVVERFAAEDDRFSYIPSATRGSDTARNIGIRAGSAPIVAFTDDDCRVAEDWLAALWAEYECDPETWGVFGRVLPRWDEVASGQSDWLQQALPMAFKDDSERRIFQGNRFNLGFGHGANMSFRRTTFERVGMFDELLGAGGPLRSWPERDLGYRVLAAGGRIVYTPDALVIHYHWRDWPKVKATYRDYGIGAGAAAGKYLRCGDMGGWYLLFEWLLDQGLRQAASGVLKWRSWRKVQTGLLQLVYPWVGMVQGWRYPVDRERMLYRRE